LQYRRDDTIAALATPAGSGAVAIVRLSGPAALEIGRALSALDPRPRYAELCTFRDADGAQLDRGLVLYFPAPRSYTGEDVVELHGHGGRVVSDLLLARAFALGARPAEPGEFTLRAFLNDKLDLLQAEAVADLVASGSGRAARAALRSLDGRFSAQVAELQAELTRLRVRVEAWLDFPEDELPFADGAATEAAIAALLARLAALGAQARQGVVLRDGLSVAIAGPPNAGKSSLLNRLAGYDAAIVTDIPGTTRDPLREHVSLGGLPVTIVDTAGLRESADPVEQEGLRRARKEVGRADRVLWVVDVREPVEAALAAARAVVAADTPFTLVRNKVDLTNGRAAAREHDGVAHLQSVAGWSAEVAGTFSARRRHLDALDHVQRALHSAREELRDGSLELVAEELRGAQTALAALTGELTSDDLLGEIFASFCIGK
jgi:tRNA modification GTPase